jgi:SPP1 family predicted phage head-tail adaptor
MRIGQLNKRVLIQRPASGVDSIGQPVGGWATVARVWADIRFASGLQAVLGDAVVSVAKASVRIRKRRDVVASMRVVHGSRVFDILAVLPDEQGDDYCDLVCETGQNDG